MSYGNRLLCVAIGRGVIALVCVCLWAPAVALAQTDAGDVRSYSQREDSTANDARVSRQPSFIVVAPVIIAREKQADAGKYKPECGEPKNSEDANFCMQARSAKAAEDAARAGEEAAKIAEQQLNLAYWGLGGLLVTVCLTCWAARSANEAAKSAAESARIMLHSERPFVVLEITEPGIELPKEGNMQIADRLFRYSLVNHGRTPALLQELKEIHPIVEGRMDVPPPLDPLKDRGILYPVGTVSVAGAPKIQANSLAEDAPGIARMLEPNSWALRRVFFQGFVRYSSPTGRHYIVGFLASFVPEGNTWVLRGGEDYNYHREEEAKNIPPHPNYPVDAQRRDLPA